MNGSKFLKFTWALARIRFLLLLRQKLGWGLIASGPALIAVAAVIGNVSYVRPDRIYWDFALGFSFIVQMILATYLGSQLFDDEKKRRTLHLILSSGVDRKSWLLGNGLGIAALLIATNLFWTLCASTASYFMYDTVGGWVPWQVLFLQSWVVLLVVLLGVLLSLVIRPLLAFIATGAVVAFVHSLDSLQRIFTNPQYGRFIDDGGGIQVVIWLGRVFPPLQWFDVKSFMGYAPNAPWHLGWELSIVGLAWAAILYLVAWLRFESMDL